jgi:hypothetical protein
MPPSTKTSATLVALISAALCGCVHRRPEPLLPGSTRPHPVEAEMLAAVDRYRAAREGIESLSGRARGTAWEGGRRSPFRQAFALVPPSSLRVELQSAIGQTLALFASDGETLYFRRRDAQEPRLGPASAEAVEETLGYHASVEELVEALLGRVPSLEVRAGDIVQRAGEEVFLPSRRAGRRVDYGVERGSGTLRSRIDYDEDGRPRLVVRYDDYSMVDGVLMPSRIRLGDPRSGESVELRMTRWTLRPTLRPEIFLPGGPA